MASHERARTGAPVCAEAAAAAAASPDAPGAPPVAPPVKHVLSRELQLYFERVAAVLRGGDLDPYPEPVNGGGAAAGRPAAAGAARAVSGAAATQVQRAVMASLASDPGTCRCSRF